MFVMADCMRSCQLSIVVRAFRDVFDKKSPLNDRDMGGLDFVSWCNVNPRMQKAWLQIFALVPRFRESLLCP
jgi:hypothetical protein